MKTLLHIITHLLWSFDERRRQREAARIPIRHLVTVNDDVPSRLSPELMSGLIANERGMMTLPELARWLQRAEHSNTDNTTG